MKITNIVLLLAVCCLQPPALHADVKAPGKEFYEIRIYHLKNAEQEKVIDNYLQNAFLPALHKMGIAKVGVFKPLANDTAADKLVCVFIPAQSIEQLLKLPAQLADDAAYNGSGAASYTEALYNNPPYARMESILLQSFPLAPRMQMPQLSSGKEERVYELRSYESATEKLNRNKVKMFNDGGEITLFKRLGFNGIFYAEVLSGSHQPNLMYMTSFENSAARDQHWKTFGDDPEWKKLKALPEYQNNVSKADILLMRATAYSDI